MIGGNRVDGPVSQPLFDGLEVRGAPQGRVDLEDRVECHERLIGKGEIVRRCFRGDRHAPLFGLPKQLDRTSRADVGNVEPTLSQFRQQQIPCHHDLFGCVGDATKSEHRGDGSLIHEAILGELEFLSMADHQQVEAAGILQGPAHQQAVHDRLPIVGNRNHPRFLEIAVICQIVPG